ncbi:hypothetical protein B5K11_02125 [Rhizobium leguminosarum bv. trifolii]|nr:hypothetical protein B5K11_02125 [Rhizobium leguminosarum bv. trifolii]
MKSPHWRRLVWFCVCVTLSGPAWSDDGVTIPGYAPATGVERGYDVQKATESDMSFWFDNSGASVTARGAFHPRMTVLSRDENGMRARWSLNAELPEGTAGPADNYQMNLLYQNSLTAYGTTTLELETDLNGFPTNLFGVDRILAHIGEMAVNGPGGTAPAENGVNGIIDKIEQNPLLIVTALAPEAQLLATGQFYQDQVMQIGQPAAGSRIEDYGGVNVPVASTWTLESTDAASHTATLSLSEEFDPAALSQSQQPATAKMMAAFPERVKNLTADQLASIKRAGKTRSVKFVVSLDDGSAVEATEIVSVTTGGFTLRTYTHILRDDMPARLPLPAVLTAKVLQRPICMSSRCHLKRRGQASSMRFPRRLRHQHRKRRGRRATTGLRRLRLSRSR